RPEVGRELAVVDAPLQLLRAAAPEERWPAARSELGIEEDRQAELAADPTRDLVRGCAGAFHVLRADRHDGDDVRGADARMHSLVAPQIDAVARARDAREQRVDDLRVTADDGEHGPV